MFIYNKTLDNNVVHGENCLHCTFILFSQIFSDNVKHDRSLFSLIDGERGGWVGSRVWSWRAMYYNMNKTFAIL